MRRHRPVEGAGFHLRSGGAEAGDEGRIAAFGPRHEHALSRDAAAELPQQSVGAGPALRHDHFAGQLPRRRGADGGERQSGVAAEREQTPRGVR